MTIARRLSSAMIILLSLTTLVAVLTGFLQPPRPMPADEGAAARIFQISIGLLLPFGLLFAATADWSDRARAARPAIVAAVAVVLAFALLYYLEHSYLY